MKLKSQLDQYKFKNSFPVSQLQINNDLEKLQFEYEAKRPKELIDLTKIFSHIKWLTEKVFGNEIKEEIKESKLNKIDSKNEKIAKNKNKDNIIQGNTYQRKPSKNSNIDEDIIL